MEREPMTEDELRQAVLDYFGDWEPDPAEGWFRASDMAGWMKTPRNTADERLRRAMERGDIEKRKRGRESWYRFTNLDGAIGGGG